MDVVEGGGSWGGGVVGHEVVKVVDSASCSYHVR